MVSSHANDLRLNVVMRADLFSSLTLCLIVVLATIAPGVHSATASPLSFEDAASTKQCEDMANRQIRLADQQLGQNSFQRALRVLNRTAENCDIPMVREKIIEVLEQWYGFIQRYGGASNIRQFNTAVSSQQYISSSQRDQFSSRVDAQVEGLIRQRFQNEDHQSAHRTCQSFSEFVGDSFEMNYYCGTAARSIGAWNTALTSYEWMWEHWSNNQSLIEREELATALKELYFGSAQFQKAYEFFQELTLQEPTPEHLLTSLTSIRGNFLEPLVHLGATFFDVQSSSSTENYISEEMARIDFPSFIQAFYIVSENGEVGTVLYGEEEDVASPSPSRLRQAPGGTSLLESSNSHMWMVRPSSNGYLALQFTRSTSPDENVRLETLHENVQNDEAWQRLYNFEFTETYPAIGSAVATLVGGAYLEDMSMNSIQNIFDTKPSLRYYCLQNESGDIVASHSFSRSNLGYGEGGWVRTSNTPALFHHSIEYDGVSIREVIWPRYMDEEWTGVVRVGIARRE